MAKTPIFEHVYISHRRKQRTHRVTDSNDVLENYALDLEGALGEKRGQQEPCSALTTRKVTGEELPRVILPVKCDAGTTGVTQTALSSLPEVSSCSRAEARSCCCHCLEQRAAVVPGQTACLLIASGQGALQTPGVTPPGCSCWVCTPLLESLQLSMQHKRKFALGAFPPNTALGHTEAFSTLQERHQGDDEHTYQQPPPQLPDEIPGFAANLPTRFPRRSVCSAAVPPLEKSQRSFKSIRDTIIASPIHTEGIQATAGYAEKNAMIHTAFGDLEGQRGNLAILSDKRSIAPRCRCPFNGLASQRHKQLCLLDEESRQRLYFQPKPLVRWNVSSLKGTAVSSHACCPTSPSSQPRHCCSS
ncbi:hypothetical protein Anapl_04645 [Anas platyrhynchos]|uniref:Uncharacterized protein n=1 Tax=Anas platyrhynchos TaxID=8839 RepID=R0LQN5_ANAPL|nr:hypothetical protein Anapl_04645 [Anas platyrhynchos]